MKLYINAGFGELIGAEMLDALRQRGFAGVRQDIPDAASAPAFCREIADSGLNAILLVAGGKMGTAGRGMPPQDIAALADATARAARDTGLFDAGRAVIEIGNEPDIAYTYDSKPALFAEAVRTSEARVRAVSDTAVVVTGGVTTTNKNGLNYIAAAVRAGLPPHCAIGYHTYRTATIPEAAHSGFASRDSEFERLRKLAAGRPIWCTETGWHTAPSKVKRFFGLFSETVQFTDDQVADFAAREIEINRRNGAIGFVWFQLNDGRDANQYEQRFGIRTLDGQWKRVADKIGALGPEVV